MHRLNHTLISAMALLLSMGAGASDAHANASPWLVLAQIRQASAQNDSGKIAQVAEQVRHQTPEALGLAPTQYAALLIDLANTLHRQGNLAEASTLYETSISTLEAANGPNAFELLQPLDGVAKVASEAGDVARSVAAQERALAIAKRTLGDSHASLLWRYDLLIKTEEDTQNRTPEANFAPLESLKAQRHQIAQLAQGNQQNYTVLGGPTSNNDKTHITVKVFYATDRRQTGAKDWSNFYGAERGNLTFGTAQVSVPKKRDVGSLPTQDFFDFVFRADPDPAKHLILERIDPASRAAFFGDLRQTIANSTLKEELIFVHGFNTSFQDGLFRAATLAVDLNVSGAPILYSWPSRGSILGYLMDRNDLTVQTKKDLAAFIYDVATATGAKKVHVIAHSMGNAYLLSALEQIAQDHPDAKGIINELIFASPDVDADDFSGRAPAIARLALRTTLYSSASDRALELSQALQAYPRAGNHVPPLFVPKLQTVDTTNAPGNFEFVGHTDFAGPALDDFRSIVWLSLPPAGRCILSQSQGAGGIVWVFGAPHCDGDAFRRAVLFVRSKNNNLSAAISDLNASISSSTAPDERQKLQAMLAVVQTFK